MRMSKEFICGLAYGVAVTLLVAMVSVTALKQVERMHQVDDNKLIDYGIHITQEMWDNRHKEVAHIETSTTDFFIKQPK